MNARKLIFEKHAPPAQALSLIDFQPPPLKNHQVLLEILASPINPADLNFIEGTYGIKPHLPSTAGIECSATVLQSHCPTLSPGDLVIPISHIGAWATHTVTSSENLIKLPPGTDPLQAAMLKVNPATAWLLLTHFEKLHPGDWVVLNASNSGVGQCIIQLAATMGIKTACFLRNETLTPTLTALGANLILPDSPEGFHTAQQTLGKNTAKLAYNAVGGDSALRLLKLLAPSGTHITYGAMARKPLTIPNGPLIFADLRIRGLWVTEWIKHTPHTTLEKTYTSLAHLIPTATLLQPIDTLHPLENFPTALQRLQDPSRSGKILFTPNS